MFWVYIPQNPEGKFYIGHTNDLATRLHSHNSTDQIRGKYTRKNGPWTLVWSEQHPARPSALRRERQIKSMKSAHWIRGHLLNEQAREGEDISKASPTPTSTPD